MSGTHISSYARVYNGLWDDEEFQGWTPGTKLVWLYLLTANWDKVPGIFKTNASEIAERANIPIEQVEKALLNIERVQRCRRDETYVWLPNALRHNYPSNRNMVASWSRYLSGYPITLLLLRALGDIEAKLRSERPEWIETFHQALTDEQRQLLDVYTSRKEPGDPPHPIIQELLAIDDAVANGRELPRSEQMALDYMKIASESKSDEVSFSGFERPAPRTTHKTKSILSAQQEGNGTTVPQSGKKVENRQQARMVRAKKKKSPNGTTVPHHPPNGTTVPDAAPNGTRSIPYNGTTSNGTTVTPSKGTTVPVPNGTTVPLLSPSFKSLRDLSENIIGDDTPRSPFETVLGFRSFNETEDASRVLEKINKTVCVCSDSSENVSGELKTFTENPKREEDKRKEKSTHTRTHAHVADDVPPTEPATQSNGNDRPALGPMLRRTPSGEIVANGPLMPSKESVSTNPRTMATEALEVLQNASQGQMVRLVSGDVLYRLQQTIDTSHPRTLTLEDFEAVGIYCLKGNPWWKKKNHQVPSVNFLVMNDRIVELVAEARKWCRENKVQVGDIVKRTKKEAENA